MGKGKKKNNIFLRGKAIIRTRLRYDIYMLELIEDFFFF